MAVYRRVYTHYEGRLSSSRWRFLILPRYALRSTFESKMVTSFFTLCFLPHIVAMGLIYVANNPALVQLLPGGGAEALSLLNVNATFFQTLLTVESYASFFLVSMVGPGLIAPDLANNALPVYLSRPFSRVEYIAGKLIVLLFLTSLLTWIPGLILLGIQTNLAGFSWLTSHVRLPLGVLFGSWIWILTISVTALAVSAWVRMKPIAVVSLFAVFFVAAAFGDAANNMLALSPRWGTLLNMPTDMRMVWAWLLSGDALWDAGRRIGRGQFDPGVPTWCGLAAMAAFSLLCLVLLTRRIRAVEVVK